MSAVITGAYVKRLMLIIAASMRMEWRLLQAQIRTINYYLFNGLTLMALPPSVIIPSKSESVPENSLVSTNTASCPLYPRKHWPCHTAVLLLINADPL
jgi:hypothetical protein